MEAHQHRREFKFVLGPGLDRVLQARVGEWLPLDRNSADGYPVLSEYFDTADRQSYWQKQQGMPNRRRMRARVYGRLDGSIPPRSFIEIKHKLEGETMKRRMPLPLDELNDLCRGKRPERWRGAAAAGDRVAAEICSLLFEHIHRPVVQIRYLRYAYDAGPEATLRVTFDADPRCRFRRKPLVPDDPDFEHPLLEPHSAIMEVKTIGPVPYWFRRLLGEFSLVPQGFSKYAVALETYEFPRRAASPSPSHALYEPQYAP